MATYKDLLAQKAKLDAQLEAARAAEIEAVIQQTRQVVLEYGLTAEDIGLAAKQKGRAGKRASVAPKYMDPKTGATWSGRGRAPAWIGKNREKFLIKRFGARRSRRAFRSAQGGNGLLAASDTPQVVRVLTVGGVDSRFHIFHCRLYL